MEMEPLPAPLQLFAQARIPQLGVVGRYLVDGCPVTALRCMHCRVLLALRCLEQLGSESMDSPQRSSFSLPWDCWQNPANMENTRFDPCIIKHQAPSRLFYYNTNTHMPIKQGAFMLST
jgi:hypothetical protein